MISTIKQWFKCLFGLHKYEYHLNFGWKCKHCYKEKVGLVDFDKIVPLSGFSALKK